MYILTISILNDLQSRASSIHNCWGVGWLKATPYFAAKLELS